MLGETFWLSSTPPVILSVRSLLTLLNTAVGPLTSAACVGEQPLLVALVPPVGRCAGARALRHVGGDGARARIVAAADWPAPVAL